MLQKQINEGETEGMMEVKPTEKEKRTIKGRKERERKPIIKICVFMPITFAIRR